ncbi:nucleotidyltransferase family protein [uncultured Adlercreutzia sp.]|uniref:nucleotidyltransferase family protein n=1 Tax=uncultured Adlercreutzia sp. TaxID=875803 RepID=UPI0026765C69|nr:nucleotidyltransferase domain-containing protein [uncultured Adlercreutzia sp.]
MLSIDSIAEGVRDVAAEYPVERIQLFGSYAQNCAREESDVDLLVEFTSLAVSLLTLSALRNRLENRLGVSVDLVHVPLPQGSFLDTGKTVTLYER